ncbi:uncharacterized protein EI97DRAFT_241292 [Westerdykella ornata]|uniref:Uncharacterized protein n=1 Tax=Westerdykella ornata TaxID=318751 RepID=A0A6A6J634_WESOR|nr:uncharacterized protein EI97DRAFT_241292 [Westerdykella ornata]KAF2271852.1 hypothetical protein EI97DRAFT_241292 [Westerdykella ornata]
MKLETRCLFHSRGHWVRLGWFGCGARETPPLNWPITPLRPGETPKVPELHLATMVTRRQSPPHPLVLSCLFCPPRPAPAASITSKVVHRRCWLFHASQSRTHKAPCSTRVNMATAFQAFQASLLAVGVGNSWARRQTTLSHLPMAFSRRKVSTLVPTP